jgi:predicted oxidoreductase
MKMEKGATITLSTNSRKGLQMKLGSSSLDVSSVALGCMRLSNDTEEAIATVQVALDHGINFFDHADIYGRGEREEVFSALWKRSPGIREKIFVQSKCGIKPGDGSGMPTRYDFSYEHILRAVEGSLQRLKTDYLDVLLLHRPDPLVEPEEVAQAFNELHQSGKVRWFGVSNQTSAQMQLLQAYVEQPLVANQVELSVVHNQLFNDGVQFNRDEAGVTSRSEGTVEFCRLHNITLQAWGPLAAGRVTGRLPDNPDPRFAATAKVVAEMADEKGVSKEAILVAWLLRHPARIQVIIGSTNAARIKATAHADEVKLTRDEWYQLFTAGRGDQVP